MAKKTIKFILSDETDLQFQSALKQWKENFPDYTVVNLEREEVAENGTPIAYAIITLEV